MSYLLVIDEGYEGQSATVYENHAEMANAVERNYDNSGHLEFKDMLIYEIKSELSAQEVYENHAENKRKAREVALAKLTEEECALLGITKS